MFSPMFYVFIMTNNHWEIAQGPMPRSEAREIARWYRTHTDPVVRTKVAK